MQDISFTYDPADLPTDPAVSGFLVGAENEDGSGGAQLPMGTLPTEDLVVTSTDPIPGQSIVMQFAVQGIHKGTGTVTTKMTTPVLAGTTVVSSNVEVKRRR